MMGFGLRASGFSLILACSTPPPKAPRPTEISTVVRADVERAETAERARQHDVARAEYERAVADAHDPKSAHFAHREYAETLETWGDLDAAKTHELAAVAAEPADAVAWQHLGLLYHALGDDSHALAALVNAKHYAPKSYWPRKSLAALHLCANDRDGAIASTARCSSSTSATACAPTSSRPSRISRSRMARSSASLDDSSGRRARPSGGRRSCAHARSAAKART